MKLSRCQSLLRLRAGRNGHHGNTQSQQSWIPTQCSASHNLGRVKHSAVCLVGACDSSTAIRQSYQSQRYIPVLESSRTSPVESVSSLSGSSRSVAGLQNRLRSQAFCGNDGSSQRGVCRAYHTDQRVLLEHEKWKQGTMPQVSDRGVDQLGDFEDNLYDYLTDEDGRLQIARFKRALSSTGLRLSDPRLKECMQAITVYQNFHKEKEKGHDGFYIDRDSFKNCISKNIVLIQKAFLNQFIVPEFKTFCESIDELYWRARDNISGNLADYIPQLARYSPNLWGVAVCTVDGQRYSVGDVNVPFCLQSVSKPLTYAMALDEHTPDVVHQYVGHEPSGLSFNKIYLDYKDKPHNPMVNAGAITVCSLLKQQFNLADRFDYVSQLLKRLAGGEYLAFNNSVFLSERETADRNFAIGYYMREKKLLESIFESNCHMYEKVVQDGRCELLAANNVSKDMCFPEGTNLMEVLDFYFQMCSIEITCESGSVMAATLANGGICPITGDKVYSAPAVRDTLSLMHSCGMYDYSGEFAFKVGLPAKSGVSGGVLLIVPNKMGFFLWSPALDSWGNSVRGVQFCKDLVSKFNFHHYDSLKFTPKKIDPSQRKIETRATEVVNLLFSAYNSDVSALTRYALRGINMNQADYDGRTALHIGAAEGHTKVVKFLLQRCNCSPFVVDRWGFKPVDDARRFNHPKVVELLEAAMKTYDENDVSRNTMIAEKLSEEIKEMDNLERYRNPRNDDGGESA